VKEHPAAVCVEETNHGNKNRKRSSPETSGRGKTSKSKPRKKKISSSTVDFSMGDGGYSAGSQLVAAVAGNAMMSDGAPPSLPLRGLQFHGSAAAGNAMMSDDVTAPQSLPVRGLQIHGSNMNRSDMMQQNHTARANNLLAQKPLPCILCQNLHVNLNLPNHDWFHPQDQCPNWQLYFHHLYHSSINQPHTGISEKRCGGINAE